MEPPVVAQERGAVDRGCDELARLEWERLEHRRRDVLANDPRCPPDLFEEELRYLRIELRAAVLAQHLAGLLGRARLPVGTLVRHGSVRLQYRQDARCQRDRLPRQAGRI